MTNDVGETKVTNFERITESHEALEEFINDVSKKCYTCGKGYTVHPVHCPFHKCLCGSVYGITQWLKEKYEE